jgi:class 3 adenylate cyclase
MRKNVLLGGVPDNLKQKINFTVQTYKYRQIYFNTMNHITLTGRGYPIMNGKKKPIIRKTVLSTSENALTLQPRKTGPVRSASETALLPFRQVLEPKTWDSASLFLMDVAGFTTTCSKMPSIKSIDMLQRFFKQVDSGLSTYGMELLEITGDAYMAMNTKPMHYEQTVRFAIFCIKTAQNTLIDEDNPSMGKLQVRTAVHSGNMHSIVLDSSPFRYTVLGPSMTIVKNLETDGHTGAVHCSAAVITLMHTDAIQKNADTAPMDKNINVVPTAAMDLLASPHKTLTLNTQSVSAAYKEEFQRHSNTTTFLVYEHPLPLESGKVVLCPFTLKFLKISSCFCSFFGFQVDELRSFRMLCGPNTNLLQCTKEFKNTFELRKKRHVSTVLYTKNGAMTGIMNIALSYRMKSSEDDMSAGVSFTNDAMSG